MIPPLSSTRGPQTVDTTPGARRHDGPRTSWAHHAPVHDAFDRGHLRVDTSWWKGRPLHEGRNAHRTNTREEMHAAQRSGANWFEGDVRGELNGSRIEMRHDRGQEVGDNLTLREWLDVGRSSGRGLKLDVKEGQHLGRILDEVAAAHVPSERLMFNLGDADMKTWGPRIRARFPDAILAVNPPAGDGPLDARRVDAMLERARDGGAPVTFVVRHDLLTPDAIARLSPHGAISVWNEPGDIPSGRIDDVTRQLRDRGVAGIIDLRAAPSLAQRVGDVVDRARGWLQDRWESLW